MGKINRWTYLARKFVECLDRNKGLKMNERVIKNSPKENENERKGPQETA